MIGLLTDADDITVLCMKVADISMGVALRSDHRHPYLRHLAGSRAWIFGEWMERRETIGGSEQEDNPPVDGKDR